MAEMENGKSEVSRDSRFKIQSGENSVIETQSEVNIVSMAQSEVNIVSMAQSEKNGNPDTQSKKNGNPDTQSKKNGNSVCGTECEVNRVSETHTEKNGVCGTLSRENCVCETKFNENCVCEKMEKMTVQSDGNLDVTDGFITNYLKNQMGTYRPRNCEKEAWGTDIDHIDESDDKHEEIVQLLKSTAPEVRWRKGLFYILKENKSETAVRKCLAFLYSNVAIGIATAENGSSATVPMEVNSAPKCLRCDDWMAVMEGLNFELTSLDTVRNIEHVEVAVGKKTDTHALTGFCFLMKALLDLSWTNLQTLRQLEEGDGQFLYNTLAMLCSGCGIDASDRSCIEEIENRIPYLIKSLGFRRSHKQSRLQWQLPDPDNEFQNLCLALHGMFRAAGNIESVL